ncbi:MAG: hypothetical protein WKF97_21535 [Chitinophagaceae bacterium]
MDTSSIMVPLGIIGVIAALYLWFYFRDKKTLDPEDKRKDQGNTLPLKLQAYERLVLLTDRIALPNLITRLNQSGLSAKETQMLLTQTIKQEYEHNITQQIYVSPEAWEAVRNLKEQNILIVNQVTSFLPANATGAELNKSLIELLVENPKASLHHIVADALSYEAKKLM